MKIHGELEVLGEVEVDRLQLHAAGLDFGEIEDVVDDREQRLAALGEREREVALLSVERRGKEEIRHADHAVHGRADLVAHVGEEGALGAIRGLRGVLRSLECELDLVAAGNLVLEPGVDRFQRGSAIAHAAL